MTFHFSYFIFSLGSLEFFIQVHAINVYKYYIISIILFYFFILSHLYYIYSALLGYEIKKKYTKNLYLEQINQYFPLFFCIHVECTSSVTYWKNIFLIYGTDRLCRFLY